MASGRSLLFDDNPGSSKRNIKWNQYLTLSISLLIESDVSGFRASVSLPISLAFLGSVCLWSPSGLSMWKIYSGSTKEHNPADFDHPSVITQMIGLQTMAHTCALWGGHSGELGLHPYGSLLVKSQMFYDFPNANFSQWSGTHKQNAKWLWMDTTWAWKQMWTIMKHSTFFLHLAKEQMSWEAIEMAKPEDTHQRL